MSAVPGPWPHCLVPRGMGSSFLGGGGRAHAVGSLVSMWTLLHFSKHLLTCQQPPPLEHFAPRLVPVYKVWRP